MTMAKRFEDLEVWQKPKELTSLIDKLSSGSFARDFGLQDQMRRASVSIMSNIAEEFESQTQVIFIQYLEFQPNARRVREDGVHYDVQH